LRAGEIVHYKGFEIAVNYDFIYKSTIAVNLDIITETRLEDIGGVGGGVIIKMDRTSNCMVLTK